MVRFIAKVTSKELTITATAKNNPARVVRYAFKLNGWYISNGLTQS